ncbi:glycosyltransferase family 2 protein [Marinimicrobium alkaliphilum]|uniref:glycosyltransferase family 2 protein n=1 Tax=Marinimicrobium alkaliphilum TaxID=2202654 RepID=UPI000DBACE25|nr:glycosyltransferase family 2 protein [Marinimicrobium alkaliphilum]
MLMYLAWPAFRPNESVDSLGSAGQYRSLSISPAFVAQRPRLLKGWYLLELAVDYAVDIAPARIEVDYGYGFEQGASFTVALPSGQRIRRICYFESTPKAIRFSPMDDEGEFSVRRFRLIRVPYFLVESPAYRWLADAQMEYMNKSIDEIKEAIKAKARQMGIRRPALMRRYFSGSLGASKKSAQYKQWMGERSKSVGTYVAEYRTLAKHVETLPVISIVLPVYNTPLVYLRACLDSVLAQVYPHWQLCIADDASSNSDVRACLASYAENDKRINVVFREDNGHIVNASNSALELAAGDYVALLDHDDLLAPHALLRVAERLVEDPSLKLVYSDEDKVDGKGQRSDPHFKPDWNPDLLLGQNYICHLTVLAADLVREVGGFRPGTEGSQDHDLLLRCLPYLTAETVVHIPDVLYHWRMIEGSTAAAASGKTYTASAGLRAVTDYLEGQGLGARAVEGRVPNSYRVIWPLSNPLPKVSLLIPTRDGVDILKPCVDSILKKTDYSALEVLILDNQTSCPRTLAYFDELRGDSRVSIHRWDHPFNFSAINNFGAKLATGDILGLVNNDIEPINGDWLREMVSHAIRPEIGCVGAKLYYPDGKLQHGGVILGIGGVAGHSHKYFPQSSYGYFSRLTLVQNLSAVTAACLLVRKSVFEAVGGLDEAHLSIAFNDVDFCLKVREAGYRNLWTPYAELYHHESVSRGAEDTREKRDRFLRETRTMRERWGSALDQDPAYNPNLSRKREDFSLDV